METIRSYIENLFRNYPNTPNVSKAKEDLLGINEDKYYELKAEGKSENEAIGIVISEFGSMDEIAPELGMDEKDIKRYVKSELSICMKIPFILSFVLGMGALVLISGGSEDMINRQVLLLFAVLALIQVLSIAAMERYGCHLIADGTQRNEVRLWS